MAKTLDIVLLLALPASGKSEVRKYLDHLSPEQRREEFCMGPTVQLDDFPYVHLMRRIDEELGALGRDPLFFLGQNRPFSDPVEWGTLIHLINDDFESLSAPARPAPASAAEQMFDRMERARKRADGPDKLSRLDPAARAALRQALEKECAEQSESLARARPDSLAGRTMVIEFARGGPDGSSMPLPAPFGYRYSLSQLCDEILRRAAVLYIWVTPEESRRKNEERADPDDPGSILHHGVPLEVMMKDYGCDDMDHLISQSDRAGFIRIDARGRTHHLPVARFDNRVDKTSFVRNDPLTWKEDQVRALHEGLKQALRRIAGA